MSTPTAADIAAEFIERYEAQIARLKDQNAELLAALRRLRATFRGAKLSEALAMADAAIAKADGTK